MTQQIKPRGCRIRSLSGVLSLLIPAIFWLAPSCARASSPGYGDLPVTSQVVTSIAKAPHSGFWVQTDGDVSVISETLAVDGAPKYENVAVRGSVVAVPGSHGYWVVTPTGDLISRGGGVPVLCEGHLSKCSNFPSSPTKQEVLVAAAATPSGKGLWAVSRDGTVWTAGDAQHYGDARNEGVVTGIAATLSGNGYYIVCSDGGVFSFGDAVFYGSTGGKKPGGHNVTGIAVSIAADTKINGYWLVADDGGVYSFGDAPFYGSTGGNDGGSRVISIVSFPGAAPNISPQQTEGYAWVHANGIVEAVYRPNVETTVVMTSRASGLVIDVSGSSRVAGAQLQQSVPKGDASQKWRMVKPVGNVNVVQFINVNSGLCMETPGQNVYNALIQSPCVVNAASQRWRVVSEASGDKIFLSELHPDWALSVNAGHAGSLILLWPYKGVPLPVISWIVTRAP